ncbi:MAG TPA: hypothetical protein VFH38_00790 [Jatrophihabitans sp.]|nr:hypothetical protein [Jatrophihabitans sp.]
MPRSRPPGRLAATAALTTSALLVAGVATAYASPSSPQQPGATSANPLYGFARIAARQHAHPNLSPSVKADSAGGAQEGEGDALEVADQAEAYAYMRSAPTDSVSSRMLLQARSQAAQLPAVHAKLTEVTARPYNSNPSGYTDPYWSNDGSGFRNVSGRVTALAVDGRTYYAGTADGGVWKSTDAGGHWHSIWDRMPSLSIGALMIGPKHSLWVGTGEANTNSDSYMGTGIYRSTNGGKNFTRVGGADLLNMQTYRLRDDHHGHVYAATSHGLYRHSDTSSKRRWQLVLKPNPNRAGSPYLTSMITDVVVRPHTHGRVVLAVNGWRNGTNRNGFYLSRTGGGRQSFHEITPKGAIDPTDIGRSSLAYAGNGKRLYAIIESPRKLVSDPNTNLQGVFVSPSGNPVGPWKQIASSKKLMASGSALTQPGYQPGIQSWYNQTIAVDPHHPRHVFIGLEEVYDSTNGGRTWHTAAPYWNYGLKCGKKCPPTTHPDQHALAITANGTLVSGNDGGVYKRPISVRGYGHWKDLNNTLYTLQYYDAAAGKRYKQYGYWGGMQDNGTGVINPGAKEQIAPMGGDGFNVYVNPTNPRQAVGEYTNLIMYSTSDDGHTVHAISPLCGYYTGKNCDPNAEFIAPFAADIHNKNHWIAVGTKVWQTHKGWATRCGSNTGGSHCDWRSVYSLGTDSASGDEYLGTAAATSGTVSYVGYATANGNPTGDPNAETFRSGIATNYGGKWHKIDTSALPNRWISRLTIDPSNPKHVYVVFNGYSRRWIPSGGVGTVWQSFNGGGTWTNITGDLPNAPGDGLAIVHNRLVLATDVGLFTAPTTGPKHWKRVAGLPNAVVNNVRPLPGKNAVVLATHGRGIWRVDF